MNAVPNRWPFNGYVLDRELAARIREWALSVMTETELNSHSQRQLMHLYIQRHLGPTLERVLGRPLPSDLEAAEAVLDSGPLTPDRVAKAIKENHHRG